MRPLNLASQPFRNARLPALLATLLLALALVTSAVHALAISRILPTQLGQAERTTRELERDLARIRSEHATLATLRPSRDDLARWEQIRRLVDQRLLRWTTLLKRLDEVLPDDVQLTTIEPALAEDSLQLHLEATSTVRGSPSLLNLVRILEEQPEFEDVAPLSLSETPNGDVLSLTTTYIPQPAAGVADASQATDEP